MRAPLAVLADDQPIAVMLDLVNSAWPGELRASWMATRKNVAAGDHVAAHPLARFGRLGRLQWITAARWDASLPSAEAAKRASRAISVWNAPSNLPLLCQTSW